MQNIEEVINQLEKKKDLLIQDIDKLRNNTSKRNDVKKLLLEYNKTLNEQKIENENIKKKIRDIAYELNSLPKFIKNKFIKDNELKELINKMS